MEQWRRYIRIEGGVEDQAVERIEGGVEDGQWRI